LNLFLKKSKNFDNLFGKLVSKNEPKPAHRPVCGGQRGNDPAIAVLNTLPGDLVSQLDRFDAVQLAEVIRVCRNSKSLAEAGRKLFQHSRTKKKSNNDSDRLSKYLAGFGLKWESVADL